MRNIRLGGRSLSLWYLPTILVFYSIVTADLPNKTAVPTCRCQTGCTCRYQMYSKLHMEELLLQSTRTQIMPHTCYMILSITTLIPRRVSLPQTNSLVSSLVPSLTLHGIDLARNLFTDGLTRPCTVTKSVLMVHSSTLRI